MTRLHTFDDERAAHAIRSAIRQECPELAIDIGTCRALQRHRFSPGWVPLLAAQARAVGDRPDGLLRHWLTRGGWQAQALHAIAKAAGMWDALTDGSRFTKCRKLASEGLPPWTLAALLNAARRDNAIEDPLAYVGTLIKNRAWVQAVERVDAHEATRHVTNGAVTNLVGALLRDMRRKEMTNA